MSMFEKRGVVEAPSNIPEITEDKKTVKTKKKKGKEIKTVQVKTTTIDSKKSTTLDIGGRTIKDFVAVDIDRSSEDFIKIGEKYVRSFIINGFPSVVYVGWLNDLFNYDGDIDTVIHIIPSDERGALDQLTAKITQFQAQLDLELKKGNIRNQTMWSDKIANLIEQRRALEQNYENLYYIQIVSNIYENSEESLKKSSQKIINKLKGRRVNVDQMYLTQEDSYKSALPIGVSFVKDRFRNFNSGALSACFPFYNSEISHSNGVFIGINMSTATPMFIDFYDRDKLLNSNISVFGQAGSGKTFFVSMLTLRSTIKDIRSVIIDPEGEYNKIAEAIGGAVIKLSTESDVGINPLDIEEEYDADGVGYVDVKSKVADVLNLVAVMVGDVSNECKSMISHVIAETYKSFGINENPESLFESSSFFDKETGEIHNKRKKAMPTFSDLRTNLAKYVKEDADMGAVILRPIVNTLRMFCRDGIYDLFDRQTSESLKNFSQAPVVNFDVSQLEESVLRPIGMYVAMSWTWEKFVKKNLKQKKRIICDEAWMLTSKNMVGHEYTATFLEKCARRIRKRNGGLLVASQNFIEFADNPQGKAVLTNTVMNIFLKQNSTDVDAVQAHFKLSDGERQFLSTAKRGEMLVRMGEESSLVFAFPFKYELDLISINRKLKND